MAIHAGVCADSKTGALTTPIYQTSTFCFESAEDGAKKFAGEKEGYLYTRASNPTTRALEIKIATLEGAEDALATASGMGAIGSVMTTFLKTGDHVICDNIVYGGTSVVMRDNLPNFGIEVTFVDTQKPEEVIKAIKPNTKILYYETPTNPNMTITDISKMTEICKKYNIKHVIDNTFAPPPIQYPIKLGVDIVIHSVTKYLNGHGDVIGGVIVGKKSDMLSIMDIAMTKLCGTPASPFNSYLVLRGIKTLPIRMERHCQNAMKVAESLESHKYVEKVLYPGLKSHPDYELAKKQMNGHFSGVLSFEIKKNINGLSGYDTCKKFLDNVKLCSLAVSLGEIDTLIEHPASMTHSNVPEEVRENTGIKDTLIRLSVGLENSEDIINDLFQALDSI